MIAIAASTLQLACRTYQSTSRLSTGEAAAGTKPKHLVDHVVCAADSAAGKQAKQAEYRRALYDMLSCMRDVRKRSDRTDAMFEPLKETAAMLHAFGIQLGDGVLKQLENAELKWKGLKKKMLNRREQLAALQQAEAVEIRRQSDAFAERVDDYRK